MMKSRLTLSPGGLNPQQQAIADSILATRGNLDGPFLAWMHSPTMAAAAEKLGAFCRYGSSLSLQESELLILLVAAHHRCIGEQQIHEPVALKSGWSAKVIAALRAGGKLPALGSDSAEALAALARELLETNRIGPARYDRTIELLGETTVVEAVGVIGYYALVAHTLNAFEMTKGDRQCNDASFSPSQP